MSGKPLARVGSLNWKLIGSRLSDWLAPCPRTLPMWHASGRPRESGDLAASLVLLGKWARLVLRKQARERWARTGVLLWVVQRPHLRRLPTPWPGCQGIADYLLQPGGRSVASSVLAELIELRKKLGNESAFVHSAKVSEALRIARHRPGVMERVRRDAAREAFPPVAPGATPEAKKVGMAAMIGPKGGLPRTKAELQQLSRAFGLSDVGTTDHLRQVLREKLEETGIIRSKDTASSRALGPSTTTAAAASSSSATAPSATEPPCCRCGLTSVLRVTGQGYNKGRRFWRCPRDRGKQCDLFQWIDAENAVVGLPVTARSGTTPSTPPPRAETSQVDPAMFQQMIQDGVQRALASMKQDRAGGEEAWLDRQLEDYQMGHTEDSESLSTADKELANEVEVPEW